MVERSYLKREDRSSMPGYSLYFSVIYILIILQYIFTWWKGGLNVPIFVALFSIIYISLSLSVCPTYFMGKSMWNCSENDRGGGGGAYFHIMGPSCMYDNQLCHFLHYGYNNLCTDLYSAITESLTMWTT